MADAVCRFNPVYSQGMSVAAREAAIFHQLLGARSALPDPLVGPGGTQHRFLSRGSPFD
jgi:hypothetical protein